MLPAEPVQPVPAGAAAAWQRLRACVAGQAGWLCSPLPAGPGVCRTCRGPADPGFARCFQCDEHVSAAPGLLADAVVPVSYAMKGGEHAGNLWRYKSEQPDAGAARAALLSLLLVFLRDHGRCAWRAAGSDPPTHVATVPSTRGRPGPHPLPGILGGCLRLPQARLTSAPAPPDPLEPGDREIDPGLFAAEGRLDRARVLLLDDTWTTGARAQSAAAAAKLVGARRVVIIVLGRHLNPAAITGQPFGRALGGRGFVPDICAVHPPGALRPSRLSPCPHGLSSTARPVTPDG